MPWCHHCKMEYVDGIERCADCGEPLSTDPPSSSSKRTKQREEIAMGVYRPVIFLRAASGPLEADMLEAMLRAAGIPVFRQGHPLDRAAGYTRSGVNLFVHVDQLEHASKLIEASSYYAEDDRMEAAGRRRSDKDNEQFGDDLWPDEEDEYDGFVRESYTRRDVRRILSWIMLIIFLCSTLGYTAYTIYSYMRR